MREKGAEAFVADAFDRNAIEAVIRKVRPEVVIDELTSLPKKYTAEEMRASAERDRKLRLVGGHNVQDAAIAGGARRYIVQSTGFFYAPGEGLATEKEPLASGASPGIAGSVRTYMRIEERVLNAPDWWELRCATVFSTGLEPTKIPRVAASPARCANSSTRSSVQVRGLSFVHVEDAAAATVAALEADRGVYNVVDDDASEMRGLAARFCSIPGGAAPREITEAEALGTAGAYAIYFATQLRGASNGRTKQKLGFTPRPLEWL